MKKIMYGNMQIYFFLYSYTDKNETWGIQLGEML